MGKTIIYLRTSTEEQNPENQRRDCISLAKGDYEVLQEQQSVFKDKDRPIFELIKKKIINNQIKEFIVWDLDRIYRNRKKLMEFFDLCKMYKCNIHSFRQQWLEDLHKIPEPFNEIMHSLMLQLMGWLAEDESKKKSDRVKIAFNNHKGKKWGRPSVHTNKKKIVWDLREKGKSIRAISKETKLSTGKVSEICSEKVKENFTSK